MAAIAAQFGCTLVAPQNFIDWHAQQDRLQPVSRRSATPSVSLRAEAGQEPETLSAQAVTSEFFSVLGDRAAPRPHLHAGQRSRRPRTRRRDQLSACGSAASAARPTSSAATCQGQLGDFEILGVMPPAFAYPVGAPRPDRRVAAERVPRRRPRPRQRVRLSLAGHRRGCATASRSSRHRRRWIRSRPGSPRRRRAGSPIASPRSSRCSDI